MSVAKLLAQAKNAAGDAAESAARGRDYGEAQAWSDLALAIDGLFHEAIRLSAEGLTEPASSASGGQARVTHGRHCTCSACAREDWTIITSPCGMHGPGCPAIYDPMGCAGDFAPCPTEEEEQA